MAGPGWSLTGLVSGTWGWGKTAEGGVPRLPGLLGVANVSPPARLITGSPPSAGDCTWSRVCSGLPIRPPCPALRSTALHTCPSLYGAHLDCTGTESLPPALQPSAPRRPGHDPEDGLSVVSGRGKGKVGLDGGGAMHWDPW